MEIKMDMVEEHLRNEYELARNINDIQAEEYYKQLLDYYLEKRKEK